MTRDVKHAPSLEAFPFPNITTFHTMENKVSFLMRGEKVKPPAIWEYNASDQGFPRKNISQKFFAITNLGKVLLEP